VLHDHQAAADNARVVQPLMIERGDTRPWIAGLAGNGPSEKKDSEGARHALFVPQCPGRIKRVARCDGDHGARPPPA